MSKVLGVVTLAFVIGLILGCTDQGIPPVPIPHISSVIPDSAAVNDTVRIFGQNFGPSRGSSTLTIGGRVVVDSAIVLWSDVEIRARIPAGVTSTTIVIVVHGQPSNIKAYAIKGFVAGNLSFALDVHPIILANCAGGSCHVNASSYAANFHQDTWAGIRAGGFTFGVNVAKPGDSTNSGYRIMLRNLQPQNPYGDFRMPYGQPALPDSQIVRILTWVQQGSLNN